MIESVATENPKEMSFIDKWMEFTIAPDLKVQHIIFIFCSVVCVILIFLCCCIRFRIPRTKQEIEADYIRRKITRKFQRQLFLIQDSEMEEMNLFRALEIVRSGLASEHVGFKFDDPLDESNVRSVDGNQFDKSQYETKNTDNVGLSQNKLLVEERANRSFGTKLVTIVNALNVLRSRKTNRSGSPETSKNTKQITV